MPSRSSSGRLAIAVCYCAGLAALAWAAWPMVGSWHRDRLAANLVESLARTPDDKIEVPIHQLAKLETSAIRPLVEAAASRRGSVADLAQEVLDHHYEAWRIRAGSNENFDLLSRLDILAEALASQIDRFGDAGKQWAERQVVKILRDVDRMPPRQVAQVLANCNEVLASIPPQGPRMRNPSSTFHPSATAAMTPLPPPAFAPNSLASAQEIFPQAAMEAGLTMDESTKTSPEASFRAPSPAQRIDSPISFQQRSRGWSPKWADTTPHSDSVPPDEPQEANLADAPSEVVDVPSPAEMHQRIVQLRLLSPDQLLLRRESADRFEAAAILAALRQMGISEAELALLPRLTSASEAERVRSIDDLSLLPAAAARRWLHRLVDDPSGEVRLRSLTAFATTNDPRLMEVARRRAVVDQDQRVADLAAKILSRRR